MPCFGPLGPATLIPAISPLLVNPISGKHAGILRGVEFALRSPLDLIPGPEAPLGGLVNRPLGDLEVQKDLTPMVALVAERVTKKRHRAQPDSLHAPATFPFGEQLPHGLTGIDQRLPQHRPGS